MTLQDVIDSILMRFNEIKDVASGSFVYFLYGQVFHKKHIGKGLASFTIGTIFAMYVAPQVHLWFETFNYNFITFVTGLLGMRITEVLIELDYRSFLTKKINQILGIKDKND